MSIVPRPTATATIRVGGARRAWPWPDSIERGEKSPEIPANRAISESEMVRRRVVHSPPRGRSSKERGSIGRSIARLLSTNQRLGGAEGRIYSGRP
jgi:hypothetical protein